MKYAALKFNGLNIGDEIQSIAAQRFLPKVDYYIYREQLDRFNSNEKVKMIMNSWYMWRPKNFPPARCINPLLISMHFTPNLRSTFLTDETRDFFRKYGPVGCRDYSTLNWLNASGVDAYYSGCLTSTLVKNDVLKERQKEKYILCIDCSEEVEHYVRSVSDYPVYAFGKNFIPCMGSIDRMTLAKAVLYMYHNAYCVITTNLHTAMPCCAFHTPVYLLLKEYGKSDYSSRFDGVEPYFNHCNELEFLNGMFDINNPRRNPDEYLKIRADLERRCKEFTCFDSEQPTLNNDFEPLHELLSIFQAKSDYKKKILLRASRRELLKMLILKTISNNCTQ